MSDIVAYFNYHHHKSIFVPDAVRLPNIAEGLSYNSFMVFTEPHFAAHYGNSIGVDLITNKIYWTDSAMLRVMDSDQHNGIYRWIGPDYPQNTKRMWFV